MILMTLQRFNQIGLYKQRMFNSNQRSKKKSVNLKDDPFVTLPLNSHLKKSKTYQTPFKSNNSTHVTRNATLSLYSFTSKKKNIKEINRKSTIKTYYENSKKENKTKRSSSCNCNKKNVKESKIRGQRRSESKQRSFSANIPIKDKESDLGVMTNLSFYRSTKNSLTSEKKVEIMSKISKIFDLITLKKDLPQQIEQILSKPLFSLRTSLRKEGRGEIAKTMLAFKNQCGQLLKNLSNADLIIFLRCLLPYSNRWNETHFVQSRKRLSEQFMRQKYFESLKKKEVNFSMDEERRLSHIQNRLNEFLEKSMKNRKVYI